MIRIAIAGISHESSTFSTHVTRLEDFTIHRGQALWEDLALRELLGDAVDAVEWIPVLRAGAVPGGAVDPDAFDGIEEEIVAGIAAAGPLDGVYLILHGAVNVRGREGAEEHLVRRVREAAGPDAVISASMDTHGNLSRELAELLDLACAHRHAPHIDQEDTHRRAVRNLLEVVERGQKPAKAYVRIPVLLAGEHTSTTVEPGAAVFGGLVPAIERHGVLDANLWVGFLWADEPRNSAAALVTAYDADAAAACAREVARAYWDARKDFTIVAPASGTWTQALDWALTRPGAPAVISDSGDNVSAGSSGDLTSALAETLARKDVSDSGLRFLFAAMVDPASVQAAIAAGEGAELDRAIGAWSDSRWAEPVSGPWTVDRLLSGALREGGDGVVGALLRRDRLSVIVQRERAYFIRPDDPAFRRSRLTGLAWADPAGYDVVVVKNGYLFPGQAAFAGSWFMALTPGGTDLDFERLAFRRIGRPLYPLDPDLEADLTPLVLS